MNELKYSNYDFFGLLYIIKKSSNFFKGSTRLQKIIMIGKYEYKLPFSFEFVRYHYGPFSFQLHTLVNDLIRAGIIEKQDVSSQVGLEAWYKLTNDGLSFFESMKKDISSDELEKLDKLWEKYRFLNKDALVVRSKELFGW